MKILGDQKRVGVFICHCGDNISRSVDIERLKEALKDENVVFVDENLYLCSVDGQKLIRDRIKSQDLDGVVVAACSPEVHQQKFRDCVESSGVNRYMVEVANIREQCAWIKDPDPTLRAIDTVRSSIKAVKHGKPRDKIDLNVVKSVLVIGGGIAGITAALSLARQNLKVYLVEKSPTIGGNMFRIGKVFSAATLSEECAMCSLGPLMSEVAEHPNVEVLNLSEVKEVKGHAGDFKVKIKVEPSMVDPDKCTSCGECSKACKVEVPDEWNVDLTTRKAVYRPFPQAVPGSYTVDVDSCVKCGACVETCSAGAINLDNEVYTVNLNVGSMVIATGYQELDPRDKEEFRYGVDGDVLTQMELARILAVNGPTSGRLLTPSTGGKPRRIVMVQCVGSRDKKPGSIPHCSTICCMVALKHANYIANHFKGTEVYICYTDMRTPGTYENYYFETQKKGEKSIRFIRGKVAEVIRDRDGKLVTRVEDTLGGGFLEVETDMVVLSCALKPSEGAESMEEIIGVSLTPELFVEEKHPKLNPTETTVPGVFVCGTAKGAMDITEAINMSRSAASQVAELLCQDTVQIEPKFALISPEKCETCGECLGHCFNGAMYMDGNVCIDPFTCTGCGSCVSKCPQNAIELPGSSDEEIFARIDGHLDDGCSKILAFLDEKIAYIAADNMGLNNVSYPSEVRIIKVPSVARLEVKHIVYAFSKGAVGIFLGDGSANTSGGQTGEALRQKVKELKDGLIFNDIDPCRLMFYEAYLPHYKGLASKLEEFSVFIKNKDT
jgi:heterodisulfide reductase subunit A1